jgi:DNA-binding MarR family transcriptional regulator
MGADQRSLHTRMRGLRTQSARQRTGSTGSVPLSEGVIQPAGNVDLGIMRDSISFQLRFTSWAVHTAFGVQFAPSDAVPRQYSVLYLVGLNPWINVKSLSAAIGVDQSTLVPTLNVCEERKWIRRRHGKPDRRVTVLELTKAGERKLQTAGRMLDAHEASVAAGLSVAERRQLLALLRRVRTNALSEKSPAAPGRSRTK